MDTGGMPPVSAAPPVRAAEGGSALSYSTEEKVFHLQRMWAEGLTCSGAWALYGGPNRETLRRWEMAWERGENTLRQAPGARGLRAREARALPRGDQGRGPQAGRPGCV